MRPKGRKTKTVNQQVLKELVGTRLWRARQKAGISSSELADRIGITRNMVTDIEAGRCGVTLWNMFAIAKALEVEPADMVPDACELNLDNDLPL